MSIQPITPEAAHALLKNDKTAIYVDVRSVPEFVEGHPEGAINLPILHQEAGQMIPNSKFSAVAQKVLPKNATLIVGCKAGPRSERTCLLLENLGFEKIHDVSGGFHGNGQNPGWKACGLPVSTGESDKSWKTLSRSDS